jgi:hypothetical protein
MYMCAIPKGFRDRAISLCSPKAVYERETLYTVSDTGIYLHFFLLRLTNILTTLNIDFHPGRLCI